MTRLSPAAVAPTPFTIFNHEIPSHFESQPWLYIPSLDACILTSQVAAAAEEAALLHRVRYKLPPHDVEIFSF